MIYSMIITLVVLSFCCSFCSSTFLWAIFANIAHMSFEFTFDFVSLPLAIAFFDFLELLLELLPELLPHQVVWFG